MRHKGKRVCTLDLETDPFVYRQTPLPFAAGFYDGESYYQTWGDNCIEEMIAYIRELPDDCIIYAHNGGGFDFWYLEPWIANPLFFINKRIAKCGFLDRHELRDSYRMIPVPLSEYQKDEIDYNKFFRNVREKYKQEIGHYLQMDCEYLYAMIMDFIERYGMALTIGSAAIKQLRLIHPQKHESDLFDARLRPWYMGGRVECFETGECKGDWKIYDVNSMYPYVMAHYSHPFGSSFCKTKTIHDSRVSFARITAESNGALPTMDKGLHFPHGVNEFWACSHEIHTGIDLGILRIKKVNECLTFNLKQSFTEFVDKFAMLKIECEERGDKGGRLFAKLLMNSSYGKFGQNARNYKDCALFDSLDELQNAGYKLGGLVGDRFVGERPAELQPYSFNNVAIAASITSASRAELMRGIAASTRPIYCDTDSIICENLARPLHDSRLGAWKTEAAADTLYIAGKKLYAAYANGMPVTIKGREKKASKGANLTADTIRRVTQGETYVNETPSPILRFGKEAKFISRNIVSTA
jgi:hypothetical protein